jgi:uncharacterized protein YidB (DUF937 family)
MEARPVGIDDILSGLLGEGGAKGNAILDRMKNFVGGDGLQGVLDKLNAGGLGDKVQSWVGNGPNQDVSPDEVEEAVGKDMVDQLAENAGVSHEEAKDGLAAMLPEFVNKLTPDGKIPGMDQIGDLLGKINLGGLFGGKK